MPFTVKDWQDSPSTATPLNAAALEDLEDRLADYVDQEVGTLRKATAITPGSSGTTSATPNTSTTAIASDAARVAWTISNTDDFEILWISKGGTAAVGSGIPVYPRETYSEGGGTPVYTGDVNVAAPIASLAYSYSQT